jgi:hypothetical protein
MEKLPSFLDVDKEICRSRCPWRFFYEPGELGGGNKGRKHKKKPGSRQLFVVKVSSFTCSRTVL